MHVNNRYLNTSQKAGKLKALQEKVTTAEKQLKKLKERIQHSTDTDEVNVDAVLHQDLLSLMTDNNSNIENQFAEGSFQHLFWEQQLQSAQLSDA